MKRICCATLAFATMSFLSAQVLAQKVDYEDSSVTVDADALKVVASGVDDIGSVFVINSVSAERARVRGTISANHECRWNNGDGSGSWYVGGELDEGENIIILSLYNLVYQGFSMRSSGGKYAYDFRLTAGSNTIHSASADVDNNSRGLKYVYFAKATKNGSSIRFEPFTQDEKKMLVQLESVVDSAYGDEGTVDINWEPILHELTR